MKLLPFSIVLLMILMTGCLPKHKYTVSVCDDRFHVERYNVNPLGVDEAYITDSTSFRFYVGKIDIEHEYLRYICTEDSIRIEKFETVSMSGPREVTETRTFSIEDLKKTSPIR